MPKSKKPRKPKSRFAQKQPTQMVNKRTFDFVRDAFRHMEFLSLMTVPNGSCTTGDLASFRDMFSYVSVLMFAGNNIDPCNFEDSSLLEEWQRACDALSDLINRMQTTGSAMPTTEETANIQSGTEIARMIINAELDTEPGWAYQVYLWQRFQCFTRKIRFEAGQADVSEVLRRRRRYAQRVKSFGILKFELIQRQEDATNCDDLLLIRNGGANQCVLTSI